ncbi:Gfo/Idh/MocA family oxidoreductase [Tissierella sp.]|uniref:Gfo/Idh/MocA family protein n=1 Tax=Tissierella sp. TaxID=41274 RepID=UPI002861BE59|nr:Gfo/Idh/MocA family oxidoreductase [Tissierella sp.]MDR7857535.1 Gfo/Idh/MocA family oxidoreductase [Tissierella sp.]
MKVCFFGLGSIGKRHLKNFIEISNEIGIDVEIYAFRTSNSFIDDYLKSNIISIITDEEKIPNDFDITFITNPTSLHYQTIKLMEEKTKHMFIEKPIFDEKEYEVDNLKLKSNGVYYVARPLVHSNVITELKKIIENEKIYSVRSICSSYLPNWRPNIDYRNVYSAKKDLGGGVSIDLIHEWDYLTYLFGFPIEVFNFQGRFSHLEIDSEDLSIYIAKYKDKLIELHLDYFGRETRRSIEILTKNGDIIGDFTNKKINFSDGRQTIEFGNEDMYVNEMRYFINKVLYEENGENNINRAYHVLRLATGRV